jgi:xanthine/uracil/vitamin C permease (AzgA family)
MFERLFQLSANRTSVRTEITAGLTTFAAMAYILAVNPAILSVTGMDAGAIITATALASALMTTVMAIATNYPLALAPGMGMNAFFAYTICVGHGIRWQAALGMTFVSGLLFLALTAAGLRRKIIEAIPAEMKAAISCGIGLFILFIGLKNGGIVVASTATFVSVGNFSSPGAILVLFGIVLTAILIQRRVRGAIIIGVIVLTVIGAFLPDGRHRAHRHRSLSARWSREHDHPQAPRHRRPPRVAGAHVHGPRRRLRRSQHRHDLSAVAGAALRRFVRQHGHAHRRLQPGGAPRRKGRLAQDRPRAGR